MKLLVINLPGTTAIYASEISSPKIAFKWLANTFAAILYNTLQRAMRRLMSFKGSSLALLGIITSCVSLMPLGSLPL